MNTHLLLTAGCALQGKKKNKAGQMHVPGTLSAEGQEFLPRPKAAVEAPPGV